MARRKRPPVDITLNGNERRQLQSWACRHSSARLRGCSRLWVAISALSASGLRTAR
jgi:hypothetical protein